MQLTAAGRAFVEPGRQLLRDAATAREGVAAVLGLASGRLDVVALPTLAVEPLVRFVSAFRRRHPGVTIHVREPESLDEAIGAVREGICELGLIDLSDEAWPQGMTGDRLGEQELVAVCGASLLPPDRHGWVTIRSLAHLPVVTTPPGTSTRRMVDEAYASAGLTPHIAVETGHREALLPLALQGTAITYLPEQMAIRTSSPETIVLHLKPALRRTIGLLRRKGALSPAAEAFREIAMANQT